MKITLPLLATVLAAAMPVSLAADQFGFHPPAWAGFLVAFASFVVVMVTLIAASDYQPARPPLSAAVVQPTAKTPKAAHPLAA